MGKLEKVIKRIYSHPIPNDIRYNDMASLLLSVGCTMYKKKGSSHRNFKHPNFPKVITLMGSEPVRSYQVKLVKELLKTIGIVQED